MDKRAIRFVQKMVDIYGVRSCFDNIDGVDELEEEGLWFECPNCGEPILVGEDWTLEEVKEYCPICECSYDGEE